MTRNDANRYNLSISDFEVFKLFLANSKMHKGWNGRYNAPMGMVLHLNVTLVNHSCAPNADIEKNDDCQDISSDLRAFKDICKGEEITICYFIDVKTFGSFQRKRKTAFKKDQGFDCKCPVCLGQVPAQEKTLKKLIELHNKLNPTPSDWKKEAIIWSRIVDLTMQLYIGNPLEKTLALDSFSRFAHLARDKDLRTKAMDMWRQLAKETKIESIQRIYEARERRMAQWSAEFSSNKAPEKREIDTILRSIKEVSDKYV